MADSEPGCYMCCSGKVTQEALRTSDLHQDLKASFGVAFNTFFTLGTTNIDLSGLLLYSEQYFFSRQFEILEARNTAC